jgi:hypothetical protein
VPTDGRVRVILGSYDGMTSPIAAPPDVTCLVVNLMRRERWTYVPPPGHDVAWIAVSDGVVRRRRSAVVLARRRNRHRDEASATSSPR